MDGRMKKQAQLGQWKTPPNAVYAQQQYDAPMSQPTAAQVAQSASVGTKMQLMGLLQQKKASTSSAPMPSSSSSSSAVPVPVMSSATVLPQNHFIGLPSASPIDASPFSSAMVIDSPTSSSGTEKRTNMKRGQNASPITRKESSPAASPAAASIDSKSVVKPQATPEDKQKNLAHSRTMARLRRQQQRVLTDSLEAEFFELCVSAAYLKAALEATPSNAPLQSEQVDRIYEQATERSLEAMLSTIPSARSQELKAHTISGRVNMPQAHFVPTLKLDEATAVYLAVTVGSRRESLSFSTERRKGALAWATSGVKDIFDVLNKDALPMMLAANCATDCPTEQVLAARLKLTPDQRERIQQLTPSVRGDVTKVLSSQRAGDMIFSDAWLSLPKTDGFMEQVRDTTTTEQMNKLISWSITNEAQISTLKLGSVSTTSSSSTAVPGQ